MLQSVVVGSEIQFVMIFPTTHWSVLAVATLDGDSSGRAALGKLCEDYHAPIRAHLRGRGFDEAQAADFTQEFFRELLASRAWKRADRARGRFRTFLLGTLMHVLNRERARQGAEKRGGGQALASLDELGDGAALAEVAEEESTAFDREWALRLMDAAMAAVERVFSGSEQWVVLVKFLPGAGAPPTYEEAAAQLGLSLPALKTAVHRVRQQFRAELRSAVARTVSAAHEIDDELSYLHRVLVAHAP